MTDSARSADPPPGWYADSPSTSRLRWWNGSAWTEHYQAVTEPVSVTESESVEPARPPMTRAERRASESPAGASSALAPPPDASHALDSAASAESEAKLQPTQVVTEPQKLPDQPEKFPDQIVDRGPRTYDRPPLPVTYRPPATTHTHTPTMRSTFVSLPQSNGPAIASLIVALLSVFCAAAVFFWLRAVDPVLADVVSLMTLLAVGAAFILAVVGIVLAWWRPTGKGTPVFALIVSALLIGAVVFLLSSGAISIALPLPS